MRLRNIKRLIKEEFPSEVRGWLDKLLSTVNLFMEDVYRLQDKNITISDNLDGQVNTFSFNGSVIIKGTSVTSSANITNVFFNAEGCTPGQVITGPGIPIGTRISSVSGTTVSITNTPTIASVNGTFTVGGAFPIVYQYNRRTKPQIVCIGQLVPLDADIGTLTLPNTLEWTFLDGSIYVTNITGLKAGKRYLITLMSLSG